MKKAQPRPSRRRRRDSAAVPALLSELPLISCVISTADRPEFVAQAVRLFQRQDYPARELIVVDDGTAVAGPFADDERIRSLRVPGGLSRGSKRQYGFEQARGAILAIWEDDQWYASQRLSYQAGPLLSGDAEITGLRPGAFLELGSWTFRTCPDAAMRDSFPRRIDPQTLLFHRDLLERLGPIPDLLTGAEENFCERAIAAGARLTALSNEGLFLPILRGQRPAGMAAWPEVAEPALPEEDRSFYLQFSSMQRLLVPRSRRVSRQPNRQKSPMVTCIMPTADRRAFVPHAIECFLQQDYPHCELVAVDDGADPVGDLIPKNRDVRYFRLSGTSTVGAKRNIACGYARGDIIVHWDDDDWSAPWRVSYQADRLLESGADICGLDRILFAGPGALRSYTYTYPKNERSWVYGGTLCYRRTLWEKNPFPNSSVGEDNDFVWSPIEKKIAALADQTFYVGIIHSRNTSPKSTWDSRWTQGPIDPVKALIGKAWDTYAALLCERDVTPAPNGAARRASKRAALVALGAGIGDVLRATPLIRVMHGLGYEVDVLVETDYPDVVSLFEGTPEIRRCFHRRSHWQGQHGGSHECLEGLAESEYEVAIYPPWAWPHNSAVQAERRLHVPESEWSPHSLNHAIERLAREAGWTEALPAPLAAPSESRFDIPPDTVALHPGCKPDWPWKKWHGFDELAAALPHVAIIGQPSDLENQNTYFGKPFDWPAHVRNFIGRLGLKDTAALLSQCRALVSNDSGMMHLGAAVGIPTFGIFGITNPAREALPLPNLFPISKQLPCESACRAMPARSDCEYHLRCLKTLTPQEVLARLNSLAPPRAERSSFTVAAAATAPAPLTPKMYGEEYFAARGKGGWPQGYHWHILRDTYRHTAALLAALLPDAESFLDAGCAKGFLVRALRDAGKSCWGFDHSRCATEHGVARARAFVERAGVDDYVFRRIFDVLVAMDLLSHLTEQQSRAFLTRARYSVRGCLVAVLPAVEAADAGRITIRDRPWWRDLLVSCGWKQDFLSRNLERNLQAEPLAAGMNWNVYLYTP